MKHIFVVTCAQKMILIKSSKYFREMKCCTQWYILCLVFIRLFIFLFVYLPGSSSGHGDITYREAPKVTRYQVLVSEGMSGFMWFWVLWNLWHNYDELLVSGLGSVYSSNIKGPCPVERY